ncbi:MAG: thiolase family protein [Alphaproteobacteria bacterium]|nr:thiolase family protein [Alphaproteobacteria bacterium]
MTKAFIIAAKRTAVLTRAKNPDQGFGNLQAHELMAPLIKDILNQVNIDPNNIDQVIAGNALYGGGNPARMAALLAGLPAQIPSLTIDSQCCGGVDSVGLAANIIKSGQADVIVAGGLESYSRSPRRYKRALDSGSKDTEYLRPPFAPNENEDPDMLASAANLAEQYSVSRESQEIYAIYSHLKAVKNRDKLEQEILPVNGHRYDSYARNLNRRACQRLSILYGTEETGLSAATIATEADGAAALLICSESFLKKVDQQDGHNILEIIGYANAGCTPQFPALGAIAATEKLLSKSKIRADQISTVEIMEAFAIQAMLFNQNFGFPEDKINKKGGAIARGHPIGASGSINLVRLFYELENQPKNSLGLAAIAAAGGLGASILVKAT